MKPAIVKIRREQCPHCGGLAPLLIGVVSCPACRGWGDVVVLVHKTEALPVVELRELKPGDRFVFVEAPFEEWAVIVAPADGDDVFYYGPLGLVHASPRSAKVKRLPPTPWAALDPRKDP